MWWPWKKKSKREETPEIHGMNSSCYVRELEPVKSIAERVFPEEAAAIKKDKPKIIYDINDDRNFGPSDWDRECQESARLNGRGW